MAVQAGWFQQPTDLTVVTFYFPFFRSDTFSLQEPDWLCHVWGSVTTPWASNEINVLQTYSAIINIHPKVNAEVAPFMSVCLRRQSQKDFKNAIDTYFSVNVRSANDPVTNAYIHVFSDRFISACSTFSPFLKPFGALLMARCA